MPYSKDLERQVYLHKDNAEEVLQDCVALVKQKTYNFSRQVAFDDCTEYWTSEIKKILKDGGPSGAQLSRIRQLFNIPYIGEDDTDGKSDSAN